MRSFPGNFNQGASVLTAVPRVLHPSLRVEWKALRELTLQGTSALTRLEGQSPSKAGLEAFVEKSKIPPHPVIFALFLLLHFLH